MWDLPPIFYPAHLTLAYTIPQLGVTLLGLPVYAATHNILAAYNFVVLVSFPLGALGAYALARHVTGSRGGGLYAGVAWGFGAWRSGQASHQQLLSLECLPWLLLCLHRYAETRQTKYLVGLFLLWTAQEYLCEYWGMFLILLIVPCALDPAARLRRAVLARHGAGRWPPSAWRSLAWLPAQMPFLALARMGAAPRGRDDRAVQRRPRRLRARAGHLAVGVMGRPGRGETAISPGLIALLLAAAACLRMVRPVRRPSCRRVGAPQAGGRGPMLVILGISAPDDASGRDVGLSVLRDLVMRTRSRARCCWRGCSGSTSRCAPGCGGAASRSAT